MSGNWKSIIHMNDICLKNLTNFDSRTETNIFRLYWQKTATWNRPTKCKFPKNIYTYNIITLLKALVLE